jgi:glycosyltransferase involved in cell wall biosynthesis
MATAIGSIARLATRGDKPLNVLTFCTHERYETGLTRTGHRFWAWRQEGIKDWDRSYAPLPSNYVLLDPGLGAAQLPPDVDFDLVLSQNKFGQFQVAQQLSRRLHLPLISLEHTLPVPSWGARQLEAIRQLRGDLNLFISEFSVGKWGWSPTDPSVRVIHHGIDTDTFSPNDMVCERKPVLLSVVNDWMNRDWCCGFRFWQEATRGLPAQVVGKTPGLSEPAKSVHDLVMKYRSAAVFVNTSLISPVPTALLEAMACGCAVVSTATCMIPEIITQGENGLLANGPEEMAHHCRLLLSDPARCERMGKAARETVLSRFSMGSFVANWNALLRSAADIPYRGPNA